MLQVFKIYIRWLTGTISWWKPPKGTVFNIPLFTGVLVELLSGWIVASGDFLSPSHDR